MLNSLLIMKEKLSFSTASQQWNDKKGHYPNNLMYSIYFNSKGKTVILLPCYFLQNFITARKKNTIFNWNWKKIEKELDLNVKKSERKIQRIEKERQGDTEKRKRKTNSITMQDKK